MDDEIEAVIAREPGGPEVLAVSRQALPPPGPGQLRIAVAAAGVNRPDVLQRLGLYPPPEGAGDVLGLEVAGRVAALGEGVSSGEGGGFVVGDRVMALLAGGGYASQANADAGSVLAVPDGVSDVEAAAFCETAFTVWTNVFEGGALAPGERLLVHGATSGIGTMAGRMASALGAEVFGTAGTDEKREAASGCGYARCWNYREADWAREVRDAGGVDVVLDMVGGDYVQRNLGCLREGGRHVSIAFLRGAAAEVSVVDIMRRRLTLTGSTLRGRAPAEKARIAGELRRHVLPLLAEGCVTPVIDGTFPLERAADAHRRMESSEHVGKIVLTVQQSASEPEALRRARRR